MCKVIFHFFTGAPVPPHLQVLIAIRCIATGSHQVTIGDCYDISQTRVSQCLKNVSRAIASLEARYINFPQARDINETIEGFYRIAGMPGVIGCVDGTHLAIRRPTVDNPEIFRCRKGFFSINVQAVCGPDLQFYNFVARWAGSVHDSRIFENSQICAALEDGRLPGHLLGDSGYPCRKYLLTPILNPRDEHEEAYNASHIKTRNTVERAFGVLKRRFAYLGTTMRTELQNTRLIAVAAVVLHNLAVTTRIVNAEERGEDEEVENREHPYRDDPGNNDVQGRVKRQQIVRQYF